MSVCLSDTLPRLNGCNDFNAIWYRVELELGKLHRVLLLRKNASVVENRGRIFVWKFVMVKNKSINNYKCESNSVCLLPFHAYTAEWISMKFGIRLDMGKNTQANCEKMLEG